MYNFSFFSKVLDGIVDEDHSVIIGPFVIIGLAFCLCSLWANAVLPGMCIGRGSQDEESVFLTKRMCLKNRVSGLATPCSCGASRAWRLHSAVQVSMHYTVFSFQVNVERAITACSANLVCMWALLSKALLVKLGKNGRTLVNQK